MYALYVSTVHLVCARHGLRAGASFRQHAASCGRIALQAGCMGSAGYRFAVSHKTDGPTLISAWLPRACL